MGKQTWRQWLRACGRDPSNPAYSTCRHGLGALTGQDGWALTAISACWELYSASDEDGQRAALEAVRNLIAALQPQCHPFARELIACSLDWSDRERLWALVTQRAANGIGR